MAIKIIAHRALISGPDKDLENSPVQIQKALDLGFDVEIDIWYTNQWMSGHDKPTFPFDETLFADTRIWFHAKNITALHKMSLIGGVNYFWHETDKYAITSQGWIWTYPGNELTEISVMVQNEHFDIKNILEMRPFGVCTDYPIGIRQKIVGHNQQ